MKRRNQKSEGGCACGQSTGVNSAEPQFSELEPALQGLLERWRVNLQPKVGAWNANHLRAYAQLFERWITQLRKQVKVLKGTEKPPEFIKEWMAAGEAGQESLMSISRAGQRLELSPDLARWVSVLTLEHLLERARFLEGWAGELRGYIAAVKMTN